MFYKAIKIQDSFYKSVNEERSDEIAELNQINIFVGQNNSGKSRFLRWLFRWNLNFRGAHHESVRKFFLSLKTDIKNAVSSLGNTVQKSGIHDESNKIPEDFLYLSNDHKFYEVLSKIESIWTTLRHTNEMTQQNAWSRIASAIEGGVRLTNFKKEYLTPPKPKIIYIPLLRWLKNPIKDDKSDRYEERIKQDYWKYLPENCEIFTWLNLFEEIKELRLGKKEWRDSVSNFEKFLCETFFNGMPVDIVPHTKGDVIEVNDDPIYDLWDWIQSIILMTFPLFKYQNEDIILLIEEPEFGLHPGMQRILLETFVNWIKGGTWKFQIFFTTHSNHFLDISLDEGRSKNIRIYQYQENSENSRIKEITLASQNKDLLDLLGVRNWSVFLSNCIIWVEWISDRIYIKKYLELLQKNKENIFQEDKHYSILEYGGGNITHFDFNSKDGDPKKINVSSVSKKNFLIADNDGPNAAPGKKERLKELKVVLWVDNVYSDFPEIENLISYEVYKKYIDDTSIHKNWEKRIRILSKEAFAKKIMKEDIGDVLRAIFIKSKKKQKDITVFGNKRLVAEKMINYMSEYDSLSPGAKKMTMKLYNFIKENNK